MKIFKILFIFSIINSVTVFAQELSNVQNVEFLTLLEKQNVTLSSNTKKWMKRYKGINLDDLTSFKFNELSGTTSVNLKIAKIDPTEEKGYKSYGTFMGLNDSGNPNAEIAYFNLATLLGVGERFRPVVRYQLGLTAQQEFKKLLNSTKLNGQTRNLNKTNLLKEIEKSKLLNGALKSKKSDTSIEFENLLKTTKFPKRRFLNPEYSFVKAIQANEPQPISGKKVIVIKNYEGDEKELSRELSIQLTLDVVFGQYDRFSGGNVVIEKDDNNMTHFISSDNGGADIIASSEIAERTAVLFSRYDKDIILKLRALESFLKGETQEFYGYTDPLVFIKELGLYFIYSPERYKQALINNFHELFEAVDANLKNHGEKIYFSN